MDLSRFKALYGTPKPGTAASLKDLGLAHSASLREFARQLDGGIFERGFLSVLSVREKVPDLGGWESVLPPGARLFAMTAFGVLFVTSTGEDIWLVDTQMGHVGEADLTMEALFNERLADPSVRSESLREELFRDWAGEYGEVDADKVLAPVPAIALAGNWWADSLQQYRVPEYLSFTAGLVIPMRFGPGAAGAATSEEDTGKK